MKIFFSDLFFNLIRCFSKRNLVWHVLAIALTYLIVASGFDWLYFLSTQNSVLDILLFPAVIIGGLVPILVPITLWSIGKIRKDPRMKTIGYALGQAAILGSIISSLYKSVTGRIQPSVNAITDISHNFQFGFLRHGIFWGWPSSHATIAFAMAFALIFLYPKSKPIIAGALLYAIYVGFGVSVSIHWFSDFIAGAIIGSLIGITVGTTMKSKPPRP